MALRFPKSARLSRAPEFQRLKRDGLSFHGKYMVFSILTNVPGCDHARVGIITSRRVGGAVVRNKVRRRLREIFRHARARLLKGVWLVIVARPHAGNASFQDLQKEWWKLAERGGIVHKEVPAP